MPLNGYRGAAFAPSACRAGAPRSEHTPKAIDAFIAHARAIDAADAVFWEAQAWALEPSLKKANAAYERYLARADARPSFARIARAILRQSSGQGR